MTPLGTVFLGSLLIFVDLRVERFDLVLDPVGWVLVLVAVGRLSQRDPGFRRPFAAAAVSGVLSLASLVEPVASARRRLAADSTVTVSSSLGTGTAGRAGCSITWP